MVSKLTLLGSALLAWGGIAVVSSLAIDTVAWKAPMVTAGLVAGTGGLVLSIIGAAKYTEY